MLRALVLFAFVAVAGAPSALSAEPLARPPESAAAAEYRAAQRWRRVDTDILYLDPALPLPPLDAPAPATPELEPSEAPTWTGPGWLGQVLIGALFAGLLLFLWSSARGQFVRFGTGLPGGDTDDPTQPAGPAAGETAPPATLAQVQAEPDRRAATIALLRLVLPRVADANGLRLHPSWTARDVLHRVSPGWPPRPLLAELTRAAEEAHFGDYPVTEDRFALHIAAAERILAAPAQGQGPGQKR